MPTNRASKAPSDLDSKRPARIARPDDTDPIEAIEAEIDAEDDDGSITVTLSTDRGDVDIQVPPIGQWRSLARNALFTRGDDLTWAASVLSAVDSRKWFEADPTKDEADQFFADWAENTGQTLGESRAARRASTRASGRTRGR